MHFFFPCLILQNHVLVAGTLQMITDGLEYQTVPYLMALTRVKGIYNRLPLIMSFLLDIDIAL